MELKNIFKMTKTDRYTQDGRDELAKLQETEDVKYKTGDISQKTGLQKQPDGSWAPPKGGGAAPKMGSPEYNEKYGLTKRDVATGKEVDRIYEKQQNRIKELKAKGYTDEQIENDKIYQQTKEDMRNVGKSKPAEGWTETRMASGKLYDLKSQGKRIIEQYDPETETKTFKLRDLNNSRAPDKEFKTLEEAKAAAGSTEEKPAAGSKPDAAKEIAEHREAAQYYKRKARSFSETDPSYSTYMKKAEEYENKAKELEGSKPAENKPADMLSSKDPAILNKYKPETEEEKNEIKKMQQFMEEETGATLRNAILARESYYNNSPSEYKNEAGKAALSNIKKIFGYGTQKDAAPRQLTGDTKIRIRK